MAPLTPTTLRVVAASLVLLALLWEVAEHIFDMALGERVVSKHRQFMPYLAMSSLALALATLWLHERFARHAAREIKENAQRTEAAQRSAKRAQIAASRLQKILERVIESLPVGIEIYDENGCLMMVNQKAHHLHPGVDYFDGIGKSFETNLWEAVNNNALPPAYGREEEWVHQRVAEHGSRKNVDIQLVPSDRWIRIYESRSPENIIVVSSMEITDLVQQTEALHDAQSEAQMARQTLISCLQTLDIGVEIYDAQDRMVLFNPKIAAMYPGLYLADDIGKTFDELVRNTLEQGRIAAAVGREDEWLAQRLATRGRTPGPTLTHLADERWINTYETRTAEGFIVAARVDVTAQILKELELSDANAQLKDATGRAQRNQLLLELALEALPIGLEIFDEQDRLVLLNAKAGQLVSAPRDPANLGMTFEHLLRRAIKAGLIPEALEAKEQWIAKRMAQRGARDRPLLMQFANGRWVSTYEKRAPNGYMVTARVDVSELVLKEIELAEANERLARLSATDSLTGIANRRTFDETLQTEWLRAARSETPLSLLVIDIDHFKDYNDAYGHLAGDECLRCVAQILSDCLRRAGEMVARYGGEEFVLLLPGAELPHAQATAERCMDRLAEAGIEHSKSSTAAHLTLSIGIGCVVPVGMGSPESLIHIADVALYRAKNAGRNRMEIAF